MEERKYIINGYVAVKRPDHPNKMQDDLVYEHILIAEMLIGRHLEEDEQVHHLDFNRKNNKKSNILVLKKGQHTKLHNWIDRLGLKPLIEAESDGEYHVEQCLNCGEYIKGYDNSKFCNKDCQDTYYAEFKHIPVDKDTLEEMTKSMNKVEIARELNTNRSTVNNWLYDLGLM